MRSRGKKLCYYKFSFVKTYMKYHRSHRNSPNQSGKAVLFDKVLGIAKIRILVCPKSASPIPKSKFSIKKKILFILKFNSLKCSAAFRELSFVSLSAITKETH